MSSRRDSTGDTESATALGDAELLRLEAELRQQFFEVERRSTPAGSTRAVTMNESPDLLKAFDRWNRVSAEAKRRGLVAEK